MIPSALVRCIIGLTSEFKVSDLREVSEIDREGHRLVFLVSAGRSGMRWLTHILVAHRNCSGGCERTMESEAFYRFVTWYRLPIDLEGVHRMLERSIWWDWGRAEVSVVASPQLSFGLDELIPRYKPDHVIFQLRDPREWVSAMEAKGFYAGLPERTDSAKVPGPQPLLERRFHHNFSRIMPRDDFFDEWLAMTQVGRLAWFWATANCLISTALAATNPKQLWHMKLHDIDQNYEYYRGLADRLALEPHIAQRRFLRMKGQFERVDSGVSQRSWREWSASEHHEFDRMVEPFMATYDSIVTTAL